MALGFAGYFRGSSTGLTTLRTRSSLLIGVCRFLQNTVFSRVRAVSTVDPQHLPCGLRDLHVSSRYEFNQLQLLRPGVKPNAR